MRHWVPYPQTTVRQNCLPHTFVGVLGSGPAWRRHVKGQNCLLPVKECWALGQLDRMHVEGRRAAPHQMHVHPSHWRGGGTTLIVQTLHNTRRKENFYENSLCSGWRKHSSLSLPSLNLSKIIRFSQTFKQNYIFVNSLIIKKKTFWPKKEQKIQTIGFTFFNVDNLAFLNDHHHNQCDQIWRFIGLWASF